ncbi:MAG: hypothetical protein K6G81_00170 [Lachnospiraceae bacterium]|nr:hypothetical protein [Lachnospiraceae bacterium]
MENSKLSGFLDEKISRKSFIRKALIGVLAAAAGIAAAPARLAGAASLSFNDNLGTLPVTAGGTGASSAEGARSNLGIEEWKEASGNITANAASMSISCPGMTSSSTVEVYSSVWGVIPLGVTAGNSSVSMSFSNSHAAASIKVRYR